MQFSIFLLKLCTIDLTKKRSQKPVVDAKIASLKNKQLFR